MERFWSVRKAIQNLLDLLHMLAVARYVAPVEIDPSETDAGKVAQAFRAEFHGDAGFRAAANFGLAAKAGRPADAQFWSRVFSMLQEKTESEA